MKYKITSKQGQNTSMDSLGFILNALGIESGGFHELLCLQGAKFSKIYKENIEEQKISSNWKLNLNTPRAEWSVVYFKHIFNH